MALVLKFFNFSKPFEFHINASGFAIGGVLIQDGHPIVFKSKKFMEIKLRWPTHEKGHLPW